MGYAFDKLQNIKHIDFVMHGEIFFEDPLCAPNEGNRTKAKRKLDFVVDARFGRVLSPLKEPEEKHKRVHLRKNARFDPSDPEVSNYATIKPIVFDLSSGFREPCKGIFSGRPAL